MDYDVWFVMGMNPATEELIPMAVSQSEEGAYNVAAEVIDALSLSYSISPERFQVAAQEIIDSLVIVPGRAFVDRSDLRG